MHLELHVMRTITSLEGESLVQVLLQHGNLLDALHQLSIHSLLVGLALLRNDGLLFRHSTETYHILLGEELLGFLGRSLEISIIYSLRNLNRGNVDLGGGGSHVALVHTTKRNLVDLVRSYTLTLLTNDLPETRRSPEGSCFRNTTRFPAKRPARTIRTVPGVMVARSLVGLASTVAGASMGKNFDTVLDICYFYRELATLSTQRNSTDRFGENRLKERNTYICGDNRSISWLHQRMDLNRTPSS